MDKTVLLVSLGERFDAARAADMAQRLTEGLDGVRLRAFAAVEEEDTYVYVDGDAGGQPEVQARLAELFPGAQARVLHLPWTWPAPRPAWMRPGTTSSRPTCCPRPRPT